MRFVPSFVLTLFIGLLVSSAFAQDVSYVWKDREHDAAVTASKTSDNMIPRSIKSIYGGWAVHFSRWQTFKASEVTNKLMADMTRILGKDDFQGCQITVASSWPTVVEKTAALYNRGVAKNLAYHQLTGSPKVVYAAVAFPQNGSRDCKVVKTAVFFENGTTAETFGDMTPQPASEADVMIP